MSQNFSLHPYLCSELVSIARTHPNSDSQAVTGNLEAISERSALILTDVPLRRGLEVSINTKDHVLNGVVKNSNFDEPLGWFIEVRLKAESRWSERWFKPEHCLALADLGALKSSKCA